MKRSLGADLNSALTAYSCMEEKENKPDIQYFHETKEDKHLLNLDKSSCLEEQNPVRT